MRASQKISNMFAASGSALVLVFIVLTIVTLELAVVSLILTRSLGDEGLLMSQNLVARQAADTAINQLTKKLYDYLVVNGQTSVNTDFAQGGSQAIVATDLSTTNPEGGTTTGVITIDAWVAQRRGYYYKIAGRARSGAVDITAYRWIKMKPCPPNGRWSATAVRPTRRERQGGPGTRRHHASGARTTASRRTPGEQPVRSL